MNTKHIPYFLVLMCFSLVSMRSYGQKEWQKIKTVEEVYQEYPERMHMLLQSFNLHLDDLREVKAAFEDNNIVLACKHLLNYYKESGRTHFLRQHLPSVSMDTDPKADSIVQNIFTIYHQSARVPQDANGHLEWTYRGPAQDMEWAWGLNRHQHLRTLLESYFYTGNPKYAKTIDLHIKDWVMSSLPYPREKSSTSMWRGLEVSFRVKVWARIFYGLIDSDDLSPATRLLLLSSLPEHAHYLHRFHAQGNWLTMEMSGLAMIATAWPEFERSPSWVAYAKEAMTQGLKYQVYPDGAQKELTSSYHHVALNNFNQFKEICRQAGEPLPSFFKEQIENMWNYLAYTMRPDGHGLLNNDADRKYNREDIMNAASQYKREDWKFIATNGVMGIRPPGAPSMLFPWAGHYIMRSGYEPDAQWAFFDIGPWGTGHQHNDKLHISVAAYGRDLLVDGGRFAYRGELAEKFRDYALSSHSHNVILIDGQVQAPGPKSTPDPLSKGHYNITERFDYAWNSFDRFNDLKGESKHTRAIGYVRGKFWVVVDHITTDRPRTIEALWHWHPNCNVQVESNQIVSTKNTRGNLKIIPVGSVNWHVKQVKGQEKPHPQGWYSEEYNKAVPNPVSIYSTEIKGNTSFVWILYPSEGDAPPIETKIMSQLQGGVAVRVTNAAGEQWDITMPFSNSAHATSYYSSFSGTIK